MPIFSCFLSSCLLFFCFGSSAAVTVFENVLILSNFVLSLVVFSVFIEVVCGREVASRVVTSTGSTLKKSLLREFQPKEELLPEAVSVR